MKIACLQFAPSVGDREGNIQRAERIIVESMSSSGTATWDWLILPEMAFSGYNFKSLEEITPFLEPTTEGRSTQWAIQVAQRLGCHVTVGYPEITKTEPPKHYNSTVTVAPTGEILLNYHKSFLYYTDETWASEGHGFFAGSLGYLGNVCHGICMDINPYRFTAEWNLFEFAKAALKAKSSMVVLSMAWLTHLTAEQLQEKPTDWDHETLSYWMERMRPLITAQGQDRVTMVFANRCGQEGGSCYAGTSVVIRVDGGKLFVLDKLGRAEEKCMIVDTEGVSIRHVLNPGDRLLTYDSLRSGHSNTGNEGGGVLGNGFGLNWLYSKHRRRCRPTHTVDILARFLILLAIA